MSQKVGEQLQSINGNAIRSRWIEVLPNRAFNGRTSGGTYDYQWKTGYREKADMTKSFFVVTDTLASDANLTTVVGAGFVGGRAVNHCANLWSQASSYIEGISCEGVKQECGLHDYLLKSHRMGATYKANAIESTDDWDIELNCVNHYEKVNMQSVRARKYVKKDSCWKPDFLEIFQKEIPQNVSCRISLTLDSNFGLNAIDKHYIDLDANLYTELNKYAAAGVFNSRTDDHAAYTAADMADVANDGGFEAAGAQAYYYGIDDVKLYVYITESLDESAPQGAEYVLDWRGTELQLDSIRNSTYRPRFTIKPSTYELILAFWDSTSKNANNKAYVDFKGLRSASTDQPLIRQITNMYYEYAGQTVASPAYKIAATSDATVTGIQRLFVEKCLNGDIDLDEHGAGDVSFEQFLQMPFHQFLNWKVVKVEDDRSTELKIAIDWANAADTTGSNNSVLICNYSKAIYINYGADGVPTGCFVEEI